MTQEDAERMGASQAVQILKPLQAMMLDQYGCPISDAYFALGKAIEALKQQTVGAVPLVDILRHLGTITAPTAEQRWARWRNE